jgi:hypothetical protein
MENAAGGLNSSEMRFILENPTKNCPAQRPGKRINDNDDISYERPQSQ